MHRLYLEGVTRRQYNSACLWEPLGAQEEGVGGRSLLSFGICVMLMHYLCKNNTLKF